MESNGASESLQMKRYASMHLLIFGKNLIQFAIFVYFLTSSVAMALPPEGFEDFAILGRGKPLGSALHGQIGYNSVD